MHRKKLVVAQLVASNERRRTPAKRSHKDAMVNPNVEGGTKNERYAPKLQRRAYNLAPKCIQSSLSWDPTRPVSTLG